MYISPFWCGVGATILSELIIIIGTVIVNIIGDKRNGKKED